jgi:hypothetical protein
VSDDERRRAAPRYVSPKGRRYALPPWLWDASDFDDARINYKSDLLGIWLLRDGEWHDDDPPDVRWNKTAKRWEIERDGKWLPLGDEYRATRVQTDPPDLATEDEINEVREKENASRIARGLSPLPVIKPPTATKPKSTTPVVTQEPVLRVLERDGNGDLLHVRTDIAEGYTLDFRVTHHDNYGRISKMDVRSTSGRTYKLDMKRWDNNDRIREWSLGRWS